MKQHNALFNYSSIIAVYISLIPIIGIYTFYKSLNLSLLFTVLFLVLNIFFRSKIIPNEKLKIERQLYIVVLLVSLLGCLFHINDLWFSGVLFFNNLLNLSLSFFALMFLVPQINSQTFLRTTEYIGVISAIAVIIQRIMIFAGNPIDPNVFFLPNVDTFRPIETISWIRPSCFFTEPAHLCIYLLPVLYTCLSDKRYLFSIIIVFGILSSGSTTGFLLFYVVILLWLYYNNKGAQRYRKLVVLLVFTLVGVLLIQEYIPLLLIENTSKLLETDASDSERLFRHVVILSRFDFFEHFSGIGLNQLSNYYRSFGINLGASGNYSNSLLYMYISYGLIGIFALIIYLLRLWTTRRFSKPLIIILIALLASDQLLFDIKLIYLITFVYCYNEMKLLPNGNPV